MSSSCSCLIPFYNEGNRVIQTLHSFQAIQVVSEIVCIDDGSSDEASIKISQQFPSVKLVRLGYNRGKSAAISRGLEEITTSHVLLFDADLSNIQPYEVSNSVEKILASADIDMIILRRIIESRFLSAIRHDIVMSGQRVLKTADLKEALAANPNRYQIEMAINQYMINNQKSVYWMPLSTKNPKKVRKAGLRKSISFYATAIKGYITFAGLVGYLRQVTLFCRQELA